MTPHHRIAAFLRLLGFAVLCAAPVCGAVAAAASSAHDAEDSNALIMTAEIALQRNDCGRASANYAVAAQRLADPKLAERAATVALNCGQYQTAERAAARWRQLSGPTNSGALRAAMRADLGLFRIDDARVAFEEWIKAASGDEAHHSSARSGAAAPSDSAQTLATRVTEVAQEAGVPATLAMVRGVQSAQMQSGAALLALSGLALDGWNYQEAVQYAQRALNAGADRAPAQMVLARASSILNRPRSARIAARNAPELDGPLS